MKKRIISIFLSIAMITCVLFTSTVDTGAREETHIPNNGDWQQFYVTNNTTEYFSLTMPNSGRLKIDIFAATYGGRIYYRLYDDDYEKTINSDFFGVDSNAPKTITIERVLSKGNYHLILEIGGKSGYIKLKTKFNNYKCNIKDNSTYENPNILKDGKVAIGAFTYTNDDTSWFKITVPSRRIVQINFYSYGTLKYSFYNRDLSKVYFYRDWALYGSDTSPSTEVQKLTLNKGTYYLKCYQGNSDGKYKIKYTSYTRPKLNCTKVTLKVKGKKQLKVSGGNGKIKWFSSNKGVAVVNSSGKVTAKRKGTCIITAKRNGYNLRCSVYVR